MCKSPPKKPLFPTDIVNFKKNQFSVPIADILYLEMDRHCVQLHTAAGTWKFWGVLEKEAEKLKPFHFSRIHRGYIVNMKYICAKSASSVTLAGGIVLPVGRKYRPEFSAQYEACRNSAERH